MNSFPTRALPHLIPGLCLLLLAGFCRGETRIGTAQVDITPPLGIPMAGYYHERGADGVLDPLYCKAIVIEQEGRRAAFVVLDIISITRAITDAARAELESARIKGDHIMISATHAHTGPVIAQHNSRFSSELGGQKQLALEYTAALPKKIAEAVLAAIERSQPASLSLASARCENLAFNRRFFMRDGSTGWNPGRLNPNIVMPAGPTDPEVGILYAERTGGNGPLDALATYVNFAMHPDTTGGSKLSADWPGALSRVLASYHGQRHLTLLANGTCGNINHINVSSKWAVSGTNEPNRIGAVLGAAVLQAYKTLKPLNPGPLLAKSERVAFALPEVTPEQAEEARRAVDATKDDRGGNFMKLVRSYRVLDVAARKGKPYEVEVQAIALGRDVAWVGLPGEVFVELGLSIKKGSPFKHTFVVELANESIGYIPDHRSYAEGAYEPESARCAAGSGEKMVDTALSLLNQLYSATPATTTQPAL